jgi:16S rRNA (cytidine1402-2'-O)-methyltransferase
MSATRPEPPDRRQPLPTALASVQLQAGRPPPGLHLVATPIGNLADITLRALQTLAGADSVFCEDTRHSRILLVHYGIGRKLEAYHEHNASRMRPEIVRRLERGESVALISDAGTPLVSDPGYKLARAAIDAGHAVFCAPGASAVLAALGVSGLAPDRFYFEGFLPPRSAARRARLGVLSAIPATLVFYESPTRLADSLADMEATLGDRDAAVARELTKLHETVWRAKLSELAARAAAAPVRGECVVLVAQAGREEASDAEIETMLAPQLETRSLRDAARDIADALGVPRARVYDAGLRLRKSGEDAGG